MTIATATTRSSTRSRSSDLDHRPIRVGTLASSPAPASLATILGQQDRVSFPLRVIGRSTAPVVPQRVGGWWLEPISIDAQLPLRARQRLDALLALGLTPKEVVLFHELGVERAPSALPPFLSSLTTRGSQQGTWFSRWAQQSLPVLVDRLSEAARRHGPPLARTLAHLTVEAVGLVVLGLGAVTIATLGLAAAAIGAALSDPCLVVVTADGHWIEIDRWDD